jgi:hypothetical protein
MSSASMGNNPQEKESGRELTHASEILSNKN